MCELRNLFLKCYNITADQQLTFVLVVYKILDFESGPGFYTGPFYLIPIYYRLSRTEIPELEK